MSVLAYPRIHFKGQCSLNPATGNNDDVRVSVDAVNVNLLPVLGQLTDDEAQAWMMEGVQAVHPVNEQLHWYLRSGWNYYGDMSLEFKDVKVTSVTGVDGATTTDDPLVGGPVQVLSSHDEHKFLQPTAKLCDLDPTGSALTQLFFESFILGHGPKLTATRNTRAFARWVLWRNAAKYPGEQNFPSCGATWQFAVRNADLNFDGVKEHTALDMLRRAASGASGILIQFCLFQAIPGITDVDLIARFQQKKDPVKNPAMSLLLGTVGVWEAGELKTVPEGRLLLRAFPTVLGPATARVQLDRDVVSLNLISTFPEADYCHPPSKYDWGTVRLAIIPEAGGEAIPISGPIDYGYSSYEATSGILDVPFDPKVVTRDDLDRGTLALRYDADGQNPARVLATEGSSIITVETDDRGVYLDVGECENISIILRERGKAPSRDVSVWLWEYQYVSDPGAPQRRAGAGLTLAGQSDAWSPTPRLGFESTIIYPKGRTKPLLIPILAAAPGAVALAFTLDGKPLPGGYPWDLASYAGVRVMPQDDYSHVPKAIRTSWDFIYGNVWRFYSVLFPSMSTIVNFSDRKFMEDNAHDIVRMTDPKKRLNSDYMPPTRDLSTGKHRLITEWASTLPMKKNPSPK